MFNKSRYTVAMFFAPFFLLIAISQIIIWQTIEFADWGYWLQHMDSLLTHIQTLNFIFDKPPTHPGTFILLLGIVGKLLGFSSDASLRGGVIVLNTLIICFLSLIAYKLRPHSLWLIGVTIPFIFNKYSSSNPLDIAVSGLLAITYLLVIWQYEQKKQTPVAISLWHGVVLGLAAATRVHITLILGLPMLLLLLFRIGWKRTLIISTIAATVFVVSTPYLWHAPFSASKKATTSVSVYYQNKTTYLAKIEIYKLSVNDLLFQAPFAALSYFALMLMLFLCKQCIPLPKPVLLTVLFLTSLSTWLIIRANVSLIRFLYPVFFILEMFLALEIEFVITKLIQIVKRHIDATIATVMLSTSTIILAVLVLVHRSFGYLPERYMFAAAELGAFTVLTCAIFFRLHNDNWHLPTD